jgi:hypothetical protein
MGLDELVRYSVRREFYRYPREPFGVWRSAFTGRGSQLAVSGFTAGA